MPFQMPEEANHFAVFGRGALNKVSHAWMRHTCKVKVKVRFLALSAGIAGNRVFDFFFYSYIIIITIQILHSALLP